MYIRRLNSPLSSNSETQHPKKPIKAFLNLTSPQNLFLLPKLKVVFSALFTLAPINIEKQQPGKRRCVTSRPLLGSGMLAPRQ